METNSDILFTKDILEKTAKEQGVNYRTVKYLYEFAIEYLHKQLEGTDCCSFYLPKIGTLCIDSRFVDDKVAEAEHELKKDPENTKYRKQRSIYQHKKDLLRKFIFEMNRPMSHSHHHSREKIKNMRVTRGKSMDEIQDEQNELYYLAKNESIDLNEFD